MNHEAPFQVAKGAYVLKTCVVFFAFAMFWFSVGCAIQTAPAEPVFERNSEGRLIAVYVGDMVSGVPHGTGIKYWLDLHGKPVACYYGDWRDGLQSGNGVRLMFDRESSHVMRFYNGSWLSDRQDGYGTQVRFRNTVFRDHILVYQGHFKKGRMHGDGHLQTIESDGTLYDEYSGEFRDGFPVAAPN